MDGALETIEIVGLTTHDDLKGFVVVIAAMFSNGHRILLDLITPLPIRSPSVLVDTLGPPSGAQIFCLLPEPKVSEYEENNDDCSDQPNDFVHEVLRSLQLCSVAITAPHISYRTS
jgi:hypothetical protein